MDTKQNLISTATELFLGKGYAAVGTTEICKTAGVNKGTFYHFFPSKSDLLIAAIDQYAEEFKASFSRIAELQVAPEEKLRKLFDVPMKANAAWRNEHGFAQGCLVGNMGLELASTDPSVQSAVVTAIDAWAREISPIVKELIEIGDPPKIDAETGANTVVGLLQAGLLLAKIYDDPQRILQMADIALGALASSPKTHVI
ncbi:TetR/AcrR family transcriptional regulator [Tritonibacter litoralis]|nr:TetR/AcrR family transcriptional regulator [Tritonibacter litoralis]